jgi:hypothetical protein
VRTVRSLRSVPPVYADRVNRTRHMIMKRELLDLSWEYPQALILLLLHASPQGTSATELARGLNLASDDRFEAMLQLLNDAGWIESLASDRAGVVWKLSPAALKRIQQEWAAAADKSRSARELLTTLLRDPTRVHRPENSQSPTLDNVLDPINISELLQWWNGGQPH